MVSGTGKAASGYHLLNTDGGMASDGRRSHGDPPGEAAIAVDLTRIRNNKEVFDEGFSGP